MNNNQNNAPMYGEESHLEIKVNHDDYIDYSTMPPEPPPFVDDFHVDNSVTSRHKKESVTQYDGWSNGDFLADNAPAPFYSINGILEVDSHGILGGASMAFKTFVALRMAHSICTGKDFMGQKVYEKGKVLYISGEGQAALARRIRALKITDGDFNNNFFVRHVTTRIDNKTDMAEIRKAIDDIKPTLVIFDTFASLVSETIEQDNSAVGRTLRLVKETCRNGHTSSLIVHHHGKDADKGLRGASAFTNDVDFSIELKRHAESMITTLSCKKMKDGEEFQDIHMEANVVELGLVRQDGHETTSLVIVKSNYVPNGKSSNKLTGNNEKAFLSLKKAISNDGIKPSQSIIEKFDVQPEKAPVTVVTFDQWRDYAYQSIAVNSDSSDTKKFKNAQKNAFWRCQKSLESSGYIGIEGNYVWLCK